MSGSADEHEADILRSWRINAGAWSRAMRSASIVSRELVTNSAILQAIASVGAPSRVLDVGCGEGWLARALAARGMRVLGIDAVPELVADAQKLGGGDFEVLDYAALVSHQWRAAPFDMAVCNFSLLGDESVASLVAALPGYLADRGLLIIQTLHPVAACGDEEYRDGWRVGNWCGFGGDFSNPAPWYFRTIESWQSLLQHSGFELLDRREPKAVIATHPSSIIWICKVRA